MIHTPKVQQWLSNTANEVLQQKVITPVSIEGVSFDLMGDFVLKNLYLEDLVGDTLVFCNQLKVGVAFLPLLHNHVEIRYLRLNYTKIHLKRPPDDEAFNLEKVLLSQEKASLKDLEESKTQSTKSSFSLNVAEVELGKTHFDFIDLRAGITVSARLKKLLLRPEKIDLKHMEFELDYLELLDPAVVVENSKPAPSYKPAKESSEDLGLPHLKFKFNGPVSLTKADFRYTDSTDTIKASADQITAFPELFSLHEKYINVNSLMLRRGACSVIFPESTNSQQANILPKDREVIYDWGGLYLDGWHIEADDVQTTQSSMELRLPQTHEILENIQLVDIEFELHDVLVSEDGLKGKAPKVHFFDGIRSIEADLSFDTNWDEKGFNLSGFQIAADSSFLRGDIFVGLPVLSANQIPFHSCSINLNVDEASLNQQTLPSFFPNDIELLSSFKVPENQLRAIVIGTLGRPLLEKLDIELPESSISTSGFIELNSKAPMVVDLSTHFDLNKTDIQRVFKYQIEESGIYLPDQLQGNLDISGTIQGVEGEYKLKSGVGSMESNFAYKQFENHLDSFRMTHKVDSLDLKSLLQQTTLGKTSFSGLIEGTGLFYENPKISFQQDVHFFDIDQFKLKNVSVDGDWEQNQLKFHLSSSDSAATFDLDGMLKSDAFNIYDVNLKVEKLDVTEYNNKPTKVSFEIGSAGRFNKDELSGNVLLQDLLINEDGNKTKLDRLLFSGFIKPDSSRFFLDSEPFKLTFNSNFDFRDIERDNNTLSARFFSPIRPEWKRDDKKFDLKAHFSNDDLVQTFNSGIQRIRIDTFSAVYNGSQPFFTMKASISELSHESYTLDSMHFYLASDPKKANWDFRLNKLKFGDDFFLPNLYLSNQYKNDEIITSLRAGENLTTPSYSLDLFTTREDSSFSSPWNISLGSSPLVLNNQHWKIDPQNHLQIADSLWEIDHFTMANGIQSFILNGQNDLEMNFKNFQLENITHLIKGIDGYIPISGEVNGEMKIAIEPDDPDQYVDLKLDSLFLQDYQLGNMSVAIKNEADKRTVFDLQLRNQLNQIKINGAINVQKTKPEVDIETRIDFQDLSAFQYLLPEGFSNLKGNTNGTVSVNGKVDSLIWTGNLSCNEITIDQTQMNNSFKLEDQEIEFYNNRAFFKSFGIKNKENHTFTLDGYLDLSTFQLPEFELTMETDDFMVINTQPKSDNTLFGALVVDLSLNAEGDIQFPNAVADITIKDETNLTFVLPPAKVELQSDLGIVDWGNNDSIESTQKIRLSADTILQDWRGTELKGRLVIEEDAMFKLDIDQKSGDFLEFTGVGILELDFTEGEPPSFSGIYKISEGLYRVSYYGLARKDFLIQQGSSIAWSGFFDDGRINIDSKHLVRTNSYSLFANQIAGVSDEEKEIYRKTLPFELILHIGGSVQAPEITFSLDLPRDIRLNYPVISTKLDQLNRSDNENSLHRQVLGLLTIGGFLPEDASGGALAPTLASTAAANSINGILTGQLNKLTGQLIKSIDIDFGLSSYSDLAESGVETQTTMSYRISKRMANERLMIEAKGNMDLNSRQSSESKLRSDFAIVYDLSESGDLKLKAFDGASYDIIYKEIRNSGLSVIFVKEFNSIDEVTKNKRNKSPLKNKDSE
ncbi:MAG: translocation/assembly module TamB domain-containing protein [Cyclobacteriaceae bacterium]